MTTFPNSLGRRDVAVSLLTKSCLLLHSVDAAAAIGDMEPDVRRAAPDEVGYWVTRAASFELITLGAEVLTLALAVTQRQQVDAVTTGARRFCAEAGLKPSFIDSSENYTIPAQSGISVSVAGTVSPANLVLRSPGPGTLLCTLGSATGALAERPVAVDEVQRVIGHATTREVVPVGSRGVAHDLENLGWNYELTVDAAGLSVPGGPGRLFLVLCDETIDVPSFQQIGRVVLI